MGLIFLNMNIEDFAKCRAVCKRWKHIIDKELIDLLLNNFFNELSKSTIDYNKNNVSFESLLDRKTVFGPLISRKTLEIKINAFFNQIKEGDCGVLKIYSFPFAVFEDFKNSKEFSFEKYRGPICDMEIILNFNRGQWNGDNIKTQQLFLMEKNSSKDEGLSFKQDWFMEKNQDGSLSFSGGIFCKQSPWVKALFSDVLSCAKKAISNPIADEANNANTDQANRKKCIVC